jgi:hypothetical protein
MTNYEIVLAEFKNPHDLLHAAQKVSKQGYKSFDTYSPFPIHGMDDAMNLKPSKLGWIVLVGGAIGLIGGFSMQTFMALDYKLVISGKPFASYPAFIPVTFELMVLVAAFSAVFGMFALNKLPQHYHPIFKSKNFKKATSDGFFLGVDSNDKLYKQENVKVFLKELNCISVEVVEEDS